MHKQELFAAMEAIAPRELALAFDNPGLIVDIEEQEISRVLVALDCTLEVVEEAKRLGCQMVLTHHPLLFTAVKRLAPDDPASAPVWKLIRYGIGMFAAHTNLDAAEGGVNTELCRLLGVENEQPVPPEQICRVGELKTEMPFSEFAERVERVLNTRVRVAGEERPVKKVMVCGGSGGSEYPYAAECGAQVLVTGECKHSQAIEAVTAGVNVIVAGHFETEAIVLKPLVEALKQRTCGVEYLFSQAGTPLRVLHG